MNRLDLSPFSLNMTITILICISILGNTHYYTAGILKVKNIFASIVAFSGVLRGVLSWFNFLYFYLKYNWINSESKMEKINSSSWSFPSVFVKSFTRIFFTSLTNYNFVNLKEVLFNFSNFFTCLK